MSVGGVVIRFGGLFLRVLQFCCAAIGLGIFSYFLAYLAEHNEPIAKRWQAVEGLTGAAVIYTIFGVLLTLCLGGNAFFGYLAVLLDILFIGAFIAVAWFTRHGANSCSGLVQTPLGEGYTGQRLNNDGGIYNTNYKTTCELNTAVFAVSIVACFLFFVSAVWQVMMVRHHKKEKAYGPGPNNGYTSGSGKRRFWQRRNNARDVETSGAYAGRRSNETGTTIGNGDLATEPKERTHF